MKHTVSGDSCVRDEAELMQVQTVEQMFSLAKQDRRNGQMHFIY